MLRDTGAAALSPLIRGCLTVACGTLQHISYPGACFCRRPPQNPILDFLDLFGGFLCQEPKHFNLQCFLCLGHGRNTSCNRLKTAEIQRFC